MNRNFSEEELAFQAEVRQFLADNLLCIAIRDGHRRLVTFAIDLNIASLKMDQGRISS